MRFSTCLRPVSAEEKSNPSALSENHMMSKPSACAIWPLLHRWADASGARDMHIFSKYSATNRNTCLYQEMFSY